MRSRLLPFLPALALSFVSCPWAEDAPLVLPEPPAPPASAAPAPAPPPPPEKPAAAPPQPAEPALPAELVDDGSDDIQEPEPPPPPHHPDREIDELASTARETWIFAEPSWKSRRIGYL